MKAIAFFIIFLRIVQPLVFEHEEKLQESSHVARFRGKRWYSGKKISFLPTEKYAALTKINTYRQDVSPPATRMREIFWDDRLAYYAEEYVEQCKYVSSPSSWREERPRTRERFPKKIGELLYVYNGTDLTYYDVLEKAIETWYGQRESYTLAENTCSNVECYAYKQLVYSETYAIGCAARSCLREKFEYGEIRSQLIVCHFYETGDNIYYIQKEPYQAGESCSQCSSSETCRFNLCSQDSLRVELQEELEEAVERQKLSQNSDSPLAIKHSLTILAVYAVLPLIISQVDSCL